MLPAGSIYEEPAVRNLTAPGRSALDTSSCSVSTKVGFMKTHKTASSTVQNVLLRHGLRLDLGFVFPARSNHLTNPNATWQMKDPFQVAFLDPVPWHK